MTTSARRSRNETHVEADPAVPTVRIVRDFDAPPQRVYRAWTDPELVARWLGPKSLTTDISVWDARTGGSWRYAQLRGGEQIASFYGSFHELRPHERIVQTFTYEGVPDGVSLETVTFTDLGDGRTRATSVAVVDSFEARDAIIASGMEGGLVEGYEKLDAILAE